MDHPLSHHSLVAAQLLGVAAAIVPWPGRDQGHWLWLLPCAVGMVLGVLTLCHNRIGNFSIYPQPKRGAILVTSGPYRFIRHPMYTALLFMMFGIAAYNGTWVNLLGAIGVLLVVTTKARLEERLLIARYPDYAAYRAGTWRFVPLIY